MADVRKTPPQSLEMEQCVLGAMILDNEQISIVSNILDATDFYWQKHKDIYMRIMTLSAFKKPIDMVTLIESCTTAEILEKIGGASYLTQLVDMTPAPRSAATYAEIVAQKAIIRAIMAESSKTISECYNGYGGDFSAFLDEAERRILEITRVKSLRANEERANKNLKTTFFHVHEAYKQLQLQRENKNKMVGIATGFKTLDAMLLGIRPSGVTTIAARPGSGKTSMLLQILDFHAMTDGRPALFSLEMIGSGLIRRLVSQRTWISERAIAAGDVTDEDHEIIKSAFDDIGKSNLVINDRPGNTPQELFRSMRASMKKYNHTVIGIDLYQKLVNETRQPQSYFLSRFMSDLEDLAQEFDIPIIGVSQVSRGIEKGNADRRPTMSDLKDAGAIEETSEVVIFVHRPDAYLNNGSPVCEFVIGKNRYGPMGFLPMRFKKECCYFEEAAQKKNNDEDGDLE